MDNYNEIVKLIAKNSFDEVHKMTMHTQKHIVECLTHYVNAHIEDTDLDKIAEITSYSYEYIRKVLKGNRNNTFIVEAAAKYITVKMGVVPEVKTQLSTNYPGRWAEISLSPVSPKLDAQLRARWDVIDGVNAICAIQ